MARRKNELPSVELRISTTPQIIELLRQLVSKGIFGKNAAEAAERLLAERLRLLIENGTLRLKKT